MLSDELSRTMDFDPIGESNLNIDLTTIPFFQTFGDGLLGLRFDLGLKRRRKLGGSLPQGLLVLFDPLGNLLVEVAGHITLGAPSPCRSEQQSGDEQQTDCKTGE